MPEHTPLTCPACRAIDRADGVEDGRLRSPEHFHVRHETALLRSLRNAQDLIADKVTTFAGSLTFVYIHAAWFGLWIAVNIGLAGLNHEFDKFPFGLLTMIVSLEAIFLSTFVMVTQNRQAARSDVRSQLDFETNLRSEIWAVHIGTALGIDVEHVELVCEEALAGVRGQLQTSPGA
ncbi:MAG: hypothetical protein QOD30_1592 [Actinomycetota bacterium]|jgi:uncharacterized membrane protein|nr:hypothetical protein [Actinomycetota bacterium]